MDEKIEEIRKELKEIADPEIGVSIMEMNLVDEIRVEGKKAVITYHLTAPFCPAMFAMHIGRSIKKKALSVEDIEEAEVTVKDHVQTEEINKMLESMV